MSLVLFLLIILVRCEPAEVECPTGAMTPAACDVI